MARDPHTFCPQGSCYRRPLRFQRRGGVRVEPSEVRQLKNFFQTALSFSALPHRAPLRGQPPAFPGSRVMSFRCNIDENKCFLAGDRSLKSFPHVCVCGFSPWTDLLLCPKGEVKQPVGIFPNSMTVSLSGLMMNVFLVQCGSHL